MKFYKNGIEEQIPKRKKQDKEKFWEIVFQRNTDLYMNYFNSISLKFEKNQIITLHGLEFYGGNCEKCKKPWVLIEKENIYHYVKFYKPECYCYYKCPLCGRSLHFEQANNSLAAGMLFYDEKIEENKKTGNKKKIRIPSPFKCFCGHKLLDMETKTQLSGIRYEKENNDYLNELRMKNKIYYETLNGELILERKF